MSISRFQLACHPEAGEARRGTSQAVSRFREALRLHVKLRAALACVTQFATGRSLAVCAARDDSSVT